MYQRGGTIIARKHRVRRSSALMHDDPITLHVAVDRERKARGTLYIDDGRTFDYKSGASIYVEFRYEDEVLTAKMLQPAGYNHIIKNVSSSISH